MFFYPPHRIPRLEPLINKTKKKVFEDVEEMLLLMKSFIWIDQYNSLFTTPLDRCVKLQLNQNTANTLCDYITSSLKIPTLKIKREDTDFRSVFPTRRFFGMIKPKWL